MQDVSNPSADREEKLEHAAKILRQSAQAKAVFELIYRGHRQFKSIEDMRAGIPGFNTNTYTAANRLAAEGIIDKNGSGKRARYLKMRFYASNRDHILRLAANKGRLTAFNTKRKVNIHLRAKTFSFSSKPRVKQIYIDDIDSFKKVRKVPNGDIHDVRGLLERTINTGICRILGQDEKKDWPGENNDIHSTRVRYSSRRVLGVFALKGRGTHGILVPSHMGKNGDQILRLFSIAADIYFVVHNEGIHENVIEIVRAHAIAESIQLGKEIKYCIIDGNDLSRLVKAYPDKFI